ncbi:MAG: hypothetical protein ACM3QS_12805 [Bacteroidota bacterium]
MNGKKLLLVWLVGLLLLVGLLFYFLGEAAWRLWNIPVMQPTFADLRSILAGVEAQRLGYDPLFQNPLDPFGRVMAYPRVWLLLGLLPLSPANTPMLAAIEISLFLAALFFFVDELDRRAVPCMAALLISPAIMLCFERANTDLIAFSLLAAALALLARLPGLAVLITELAAILKLYPVIALGMLLREPKKVAALWLSAGLAVFAVYAAFTWADIRQVLAMASKGVGFNYGVTVIGMWLLDVTGSARLAGAAVALGYLVAYLLLLFALYRSYRDAQAFPITDARWLDAFRVGALLYVGTFLQGNTWNYRLVFLIFTVPQLVDWLRAGTPRSRRMAGMTLALTLLSAWSPLLGAREPPSSSIPGILQVLFDELWNWGLLGAFSYLLFATLPAWIREQITLFFEKYRKSASLSPSA